MSFSTWWTPAPRPCPITPLFFLINSYTTGFQASVLSNLLERLVRSRLGGTVDAQELCLPVTSGGVLPCGASGRWFRA